MTNLKAIERIQAMLDYMRQLDADEEEEKDIEAFETAISALKVAENLKEIKVKESAKTIEMLLSNLPCDHDCDECTLSKQRMTEESNDYEVYGCELVDWLKEKKDGASWIVTDRCPENEKTVLVLCQYEYMDEGKKVKGSPFWSLGFYEDGSLTTENSLYYWNEDACPDESYIEELDAYRVPQGWWEKVNFGEEFTAISCNVLGWCELPNKNKE